MVVSEAHNISCEDFMAKIPDKFFDLVIADPPYGIGFSSYQRGSSGKKVKERYTSEGKKGWDAGIPPDSVFQEIFRISKNQIIWGGNYFPYLTWEETPNLKKKEDFEAYCADSLFNWIFWYKKNPVPNFADGELAWSSFSDKYTEFEYMYYGNINSEKDRIHPTQKPRELYDFLMRRYCTKGMKVYDPFLGSGSSRIVAEILGIDFWATELDKDIFNKQELRFKRRLQESGLNIQI